MKRNIALLGASAVLGAILALPAGWGVSVLNWERLNAPFRWAGEGLRWLSLSGLPGNALAWAIVWAVGALPLLLLWKRRGREWAGEDYLPVIAAPVLWLGLFFLVNPTWLNTPLVEMHHWGVVATALSLVVGWGILKLLRNMEGASTQTLARSFRTLFRVCAVLLAAGATFTQIFDLLTRWNTVVEGNTAHPNDLGVTLGMLVVLAVLRLIPDLLAGMTLLWGGELAGALSTGRFDQESVALSRATADSCRRAAQTCVAVAAAANVLQLAAMGLLRDLTFRLDIPLLSIALSVGLFLICRLLQRGQALQEDSDSII